MMMGGGMLFFSLIALLFLLLLLGVPFLLLAGFGYLFVRGKGNEQPGQEGPSLERACTSCGHLLQAQWVLCPYCGERIS